MKNRLQFPFVLFFASEQSDADSSNRSSETSLPKSSLASFPKASHANPVDSSSASLLKQVIQTSGNPKRKHAEILENSGAGGTVKVHQKDCCEKRNLDTRKICQCPLFIFLILFAM